MKIYIKNILIICVILFVISLFQINKLPKKNDILPELYREPVQAETQEKEFKVEKQGIAYTITPLYTYELYGLIATYQHSNSLINATHKFVKDYLNIKDISVIWGHNIKSETYLKVRFAHGDFTGYFSYDDPSLDFREICFSNNHLLTNNDLVANEIMKSTTGDQIYLKGYLVSYTQSSWSGSRRSSITRDDHQDGACEVIFVTEYKILKEGNFEARIINKLSKIVGIICLVLLIADIYNSAKKQPILKLPETL